MVYGSQFLKSITWRLLVYLCCMFQQSLIINGSPKRNNPWILKCLLPGTKGSLWRLWMIYGSRFAAGFCSVLFNSSTWIFPEVQPNGLFRVLHFLRYSPFCVFGSRFLKWFNVVEFCKGSFKGSMFMASIVYVPGFIRWFHCTLLNKEPLCWIYKKRSVLQEWVRALPGHSIFFWTSDGTWGLFNDTMWI